MNKEQKLLKLICLQDDYYKLFVNDYNSLAIFAHVHGWKWEQKLINTCRELRKKINEQRKEMGLNEIT